jgi:hypothetical protein
MKDVTEIMWAVWARPRLQRNSTRGPVRIYAVEDAARQYAATYSPPGAVRRVMVRLRVLDGEFAQAWARGRVAKTPEVPR